MCDNCFGYACACSCFCFCYVQDAAYGSDCVGDLADSVGRTFAASTSIS